MEHRPFENDLDFLEHEVAWVAARCRHLAAVKDHEDDQQQHADRPKSCCRRRNTAEAEVPATLASLKQYEDDVRTEIDCRIAATEAVGVTLGLQVAVRDLDLDHADRNVLILCLIPCLGTRATEPLERVGTFGQIGAIASEVVAVFNGFGFADRLRRLRFSTEHKLVRAGLVTTDTDDDAPPGDWPNTSIKLTHKGFVVLTGLSPTPTEATDK
jgi:hypothetical protein